MLQSHDLAISVHRCFEQTIVVDIHEIQSVAKCGHEQFEKPLKNGAIGVIHVEIHSKSLHEILIC